MTRGLDRRSFVTGGLLAAGFAGCRSVCSCASGTSGGSLNVLISDIHIGGADKRFEHTQARLGKVVNAILAMDPKPDNVICFGDVAMSFGLGCDYDVSKPILQRIVDAGIKLTLTLGNHDRRSEFLKRWPEYRTSSPVPGRVVSVVDLGTADLVLLDTLKGTDDRPANDMGPVEGTIDPAQLAWLESFVAGAKRPFFVGSHQFRDLYIDGPGPVKRVAKSPYAQGWIYGHDHGWSTGLHIASWKDDRLMMSLALPSTGLWGDIGYVTLRTDEMGAVAELHQDDFYFRTPGSVVPRPAAWDARVRDNSGQTLHFVYPSGQGVETRI